MSSPPRELRSSPHRGDGEAHAPGRRSPTTPGTPRHRGRSRLLANHLRALLLATLLPGPACDDAEDTSAEPAIEHEGERFDTERMEVYNQLEIPLCAGSLAAWEAHIDEIAEALGFSGTIEPFATVIVPNSRDICNHRGGGGCAVYDSNFVAGESRHIPHEIAHMVKFKAQGSSARPGLEEGFAEAWSGRGGRLPVATLASLLTAGSHREVDYAAARHWIRWVATTYGWPTTATLLERSRRSDDPEETFAQIEELLGAPWSELQYAFWREAPLYDPGPTHCDTVAGTVSFDQPLRLEIPLACDRADTFGPAPQRRRDDEPSLGTSRVFEVTDDGSYYAQVSPGRFVILPCEPVNEPVAADFWAFLDSSRNLSPGFGYPAHKRDRRLELPKGRYIAWVIAEGTEPTTIRLAIDAYRPASRIAGIQ